MRGVAVITAICLVAGLAAGCSEDDDDLTGVNNDCSSLSGTFTASSFLVNGTQNTTLTQNMLNNGGAFSLTFNSNGNFNSSFTAQTNATPVTQTGTFNFANGMLTLGSTPLFTGAATGTQAFNCTRVGNTLTLSNANTNFTFAGQSAAQPASISVVLNRSGI